MSFITIVLFLLGVIGIEEVLTAWTLNKIGLWTKRPKHPEVSWFK